MTLRLRLMLIIGTSFTLLWVITSIWMFYDLRNEFRDALDERLAASARMVAGLVAQMPETAESPNYSSRGVVDIAARDGIACEIRLQGGALLARTHGSPSGLSLVTTGFSTRTINGQQWRSYTLEQGGKRVTTADRVVKREALLREIIVATALPFLIAMAGSLIVLWFGIRRGLSPLESIRSALAASKPEAIEPLPETRTPAELTPLVHTINLLLRRTQHAIARERRFTGDAAHELRTPLTAIKTHIQVARLSDDADKTTALEQAEASVQRLQHTLEQLLTLARLEGPFSFGGEAAPDGSTVARLAIDEVSHEARQRIHLEATEGHHALAVPTSLAVTAVRNILDNALRYSADDQPVTLRVIESGMAVLFEVVDQGPGMTTDDRHDAVRRFWRKGNGQGSGLGLSIVDAIVNRYGGSFQLMPGLEYGTVAQIRLPTTQNDPAKADAAALAKASSNAGYR